MSFSDQFARMDPKLRADLHVMAENAGFTEKDLGAAHIRLFCEVMAVAARLGEMSLRAQAPTPQ